MARIPQFWQAGIVTVKVNFFRKYHRSEDLHLYWFDHQHNKIISNYTLDYSSSVWILDEVKYNRFAEIYAVRSGGWYGSEKGGRWNALKRTDGEITFQGVSNFNHDSYSTVVPQDFVLTKQRFSNLIKIQVNNDSVGHLTFFCKKILFHPSKKISLLQRADEEYIDASEILANNGLHLIESKFNLQD